MVAGGEALIPPHDWVGQDPEDGRFYWHRGVQSIGEGDIDEGQARLRQMVENIRNHSIETLKTLPKPKRSMGGLAGLASLPMAA
jgi:hypothetical protein